jgi:hypothetical protein
MSEQCRDGVAIQPFAPCPECGATGDQTCRGRMYKEVQRLRAERETKALAETSKIELPRDRRQSP